MARIFLIEDNGRLGRFSHPEFPRRHGVRHRPEASSRLPCLFLQLLPFDADGAITVPREQPGESLPYQLLVEQRIPYLNEGHRAPVAVFGHWLDFYHL